MFENETFPIFAHLQAKERARENNRFSVLKSLPARTAHAPQAHREARAPIGGELSITAGEPKANLRKLSLYKQDPMGVQLPTTAGRPQAHPRSSEAADRPVVTAESSAVRTTSA